MNLFEANFTLLDIERTLEEELRANEKRARTIGDLELTYEDYKYLTFKLQGLTRYLSKIEVIERYNLCIVTALVFGLRYDKDKNLVYNRVKDILEHIQQHQLRYYIKICMVTFYELGFSTYGVDLRNIDDIFEVSLIHAGFEEQLNDDIFALLDEYYDSSEGFLQTKKLARMITVKIHQMYPFLNSEHTYRIIGIMKRIFESCKVRHLSLEELNREYPNISRKLLNSCYMWCLKYDESSSRLIRMR